MQEILQTDSGDTTSLKDLAYRLKRKSVAADVISFCEAVIAYQDGNDCPACIERRARKCEAQQRWREKRKGKLNER